MKFGGACGLALATAVTVATPLRAQDVGPGERPFNAALYKASHNSYARNESLASQLDDFNVWQLELDVYDYRDQLKVNHDCDLVAIDVRAEALGSLLTRLVNESTTWRQKFTVIYLDLKGNGGDGCQVQWGSELRQRLAAEVSAALPVGTLYPAAALERAGGVWPSYQGLTRRGYSWAVIVDWHGGSPTAGVDDTLLFSATSDVPPDPRRLAPNAVLVNLDGGCDAIPAALASRSRDEARWLYRLWPGACGQQCPQLDGAYWKNGSRDAAGINFLATNCVDRDHTFEPPVHSPAPLFVLPSVAVTCPHDYASCEWGTRRFPFHDLVAGIQRASAMVPVVIAAGAYRVTVSGAFSIRNPVELTTDGSGPVTLR